MSLQRSAGYQLFKDSDLSDDVADCVLPLTIGKKEIRNIKQFAEQRREK